MTPRNRNAGSSVQKWTSRSSASPGHSLGSPTQAAWVIRLVSKMPNAAATRHPTTMPITGAQSRHSALPRSVSAATTVSVANAVSGAAVGSSSDAPSSRSNTTEASVMERIIITVSLTTGVTSRRRMNSHLAMMNWNAAEASTSVVSVAGPPSTTAVMQKGDGEGRREERHHRARAHRAQSAHLHQRGEADHHQRREDHPRHIGLAPARRVRHDHRRHQQRGGGDHAELQTKTERDPPGRILVRLVAGVLS